MSSTKWDAPYKEWLKAILQWAVVGSAAGVLWILTIFPMGMLVAAFAKPLPGPYNEPKTKHDQKYIDQGSSGWWEYISVDIPILIYFTVYEDGLLGEPSGKHSARVGGKERTWWNMYSWICRNPYNYIKRTTRFFACFVNDADLTYWGDEVVSDKTLTDDGSYLIKGVDRTTGKTYYGYRKVVHWDNVGWYVKLKGLFAKVPFLNKYSSALDGRVYHALFGFKIRPTHIGQVQDADDLDKAFTFRIQFWTYVD